MIGVGRHPAAAAMAAWQNIDGAAFGAAWRRRRKRGTARRHGAAQRRGGGANARGMAARMAATIITNSIVAPVAAFYSNNFSGSMA